MTGSTSTNGFTTTGYSYDSNGNNTADGLNSYSYDAENRIITASVSGTMYCYTYDGNGMRVMKAHGTNCSSVTVDMLYWRSISGDTIAETDGTGSTTNSSYHEYVFFSGQRIAQSNPSSGTVYYYFADHLGSTRVVTNSSGSACYEADYLPYGSENTPSGFTNTCSTSYRFTGYERDAETSSINGGMYYAFARYYNSRMGRFQQGDPLAGDVEDPQTLNRYSYVWNNPVNLTDPSGMLADFGDPAWGSGWGVFPAELEGEMDWGPGSHIGRSTGFNSAFVDALNRSAYFNGGNTNCFNGFGGAVMCDGEEDVGLYESQGQFSNSNKEGELITAALSERNLTKCLNKFFGPRIKLTRANAPKIDATQDLFNGAVGRTIPSQVPAKGRATIQIDKGTFKGLRANDSYLVGTYLHETANALAIQLFTGWQPRGARALLGPRGTAPSHEQQFDFIDPDIGKQFEHCIRN